MKFTLSWLKDHLDTEAGLGEITERLTAIGLEVEHVDDGAAFRPFTIARVLTAQPHPDADKLRVLSDPKQAIPGYDAILLVAPRRADDARFTAGRLAALRARRRRGRRFASHPRGLMGPWTTTDASPRCGSCPPSRSSPSRTRTPRGGR